MDIKHKCKYCKKIFFRKKNKTKKHLFCSAKCMGKSKKRTITLSCLSCQKEIKRQPSHVHTKNFCSKECRGQWHCGEKANRWKGGLTKLNGGYLFKLVGINKYYAVHRLVMEKYLGRRLKITEIIHHKNEDITDNRIENLEIMTRAEHARHHKPRKDTGIKTVEVTVLNNL